MLLYEQISKLDQTMMNERNGGEERKKKKKNYKINVTIGFRLQLIN